MPQPGMSGMEPVFGEAYGSHRSLFTSYPLSASPLGGRTECDQSVVLMLGSAAVPQKRPFELLSDLVDDGFGEDLHHELWDISALDDFTYYTKGSAEGEPASSEGVLIGRWGDRKDGGRQEERQQRDQLGLSGKQQQEGSEPATEERLITQKGKVTEASCVEVFERPECQDVVSPSSPAPALELCSEEHNYSLQADRASSSSQGSDSETADTEEEEEEEEEKDEEEVEIGDDKTRHAEHGSNDKRVGERPAKRRCFWEYNHAHDTGSKGLGVRWPFSWNSSTLPSTLYRREGTSGKKGRRKARKTDASDLTPNPQKLCSIGEQLQKLNVAIDGMGHVNDLPVVARARSRKEKNKLASRACRLKKKAQHEANKIKLWGLNQEYENLLGSLLRIKEVIRQRVERSEEDGSVGMTKQLEDILKESSGPLVAGRTREFVERILQCSAGRQEERKTQGESKTSS